MKLDKNYQLVQDKNGNFAHKVGNRDDHFVLFCDPENMIYYRKYLNIDSFIRLEKIDDPELLKQYKERDMSVLTKIYTLLTFKDFCWNFSSVDASRRRSFPKQFLQNECSPYPCYVFQSALSKAFNENATITCSIDVSEFIKLKNGPNPAVIEMA